MAALEGKIEIGTEYRPCMVHIPEKTIETQDKNARLTIRVSKEAEEHKALFHYWSYRSKLDDDGFLMSGTFAIVEYEDGTVHEVEPWNIRFVDNVMCEYAFPEMEETKS